MSLWTGRLVLLGAIFFLLGWGLVLLSGHGGNSTGGPEAVWTVGGIMVYASFPVFVIAAAVGLISRFGGRRSSLTR